MTAQLNLVTCQQILDAASQFLGESSTPSNQNTIRINFANMGLNSVAYERNWSWEFKEPTPINLVSGQSSYSLTLTDVKGAQSLDYVQVSDNSGNAQALWPYYTPVDYETYKGIVNKSMTDQVYSIVGNNTNGYTLYINPAPTYSVTGGIAFGYYQMFTALVNTTDTTNFPQADTIGWFVAARVYLGYREQAQYQLSMKEFSDDIVQMAAYDFKKIPHADTKILSLREAKGLSNNYRSYY